MIAAPNVEIQVENQQYINPTPGEISIVGLGRMRHQEKSGEITTEPYITEEAATLLFEIGCNASQAQVSIGTDAPEYTGVKNSLESCGRAGIKMIPKYGLLANGAGCIYFYEIPEQYSYWTTSWGRIAEKFRNHPALGGWFLADEPAAVAMSSLAQAKDEILSKDPNHDVLVNLFGEYASKKEDIRRLQLNGRIEPRPNVTTPSTIPDLVITLSDYYDYYDKVFGPAIWSSDFYPFAISLKNPALRTDFYDYLLMMRNRSTSTGRPFWTYVACNFNYPTDNGNISKAAKNSSLTLGRLRFQVFMALAYGAQGICYWNIFGDRDVYNAMPVDVNGKKTVLFDIVKTVNQEIKSYNSVFCGGDAKYLAVIKDARKDRTDEKLPVITVPNKYIREFNKQSKDKWLYAEYQNGENNYLILLNMDYLKKKKARIGFNTSAAKVRRVVPGGGETDYITEYKGDVSAGGVVIFKIEE